MITLICGVCRAGKTTYSQKYDNVIHLDDMGKVPDRYHNVSYTVSRLHDDIVVEGVYDTAKLRKDLLEHYHGNGKRTCIWLNPSEEEIQNRPWAKRHGYHKYPFEPPTYDEGWDEIIIIGGEDNGNI